MLEYRLKKAFFVLIFLLDIFNLQMFANDNKKVEARNNKYGKQYKVAVCDWMILKRQKIGSFELIRELNGDGVELDMGSLGQRDSFDNKLREPEFQKLFKEKSKEYGIEISSIAMSGFYGQSFAQRSNYRDLVEDCLTTMQIMEVKTAFLPLGIKCDLNKYPNLRPVIVERLKVIGKMAEKAGVVIGIETTLDARGDVKLLNEIHSKGIKISFNFQNELESGRDLTKELRILGKNNICQIHCTDTDGVTLPNDKKIDMNKVKKTLNEMGWYGWLVVERSRDGADVHNVKKNYGTNIRFLKSCFNII